MRFLLILLSVINLYANDVESWVENKNYKKLCDTNIFNLAQSNKDEALMNEYAHACMQLNQVNRLAMPSVVLRNSQEARVNSIIYTTLLLKKKLLCAAVVDGLDISSLRLIKVDNPLSFVFDAYQKKEYTKEGDTFIIKEEQKIHKLYATTVKGEKRIRIDTYDGDKLQDSKEYW